MKSQEGEAALSSLDFTPCSEETLARAVLAAVSLGMAWAVNSPCSKVILFPGGAEAPGLLHQVCWTM